MSLPLLASPLTLVMVGLPARGKTHTAQKLECYLSWLGYATRVFNAGDYRRRMHGARQSASFFDHAHEAHAARRHEAAARTLEDLLDWQRQGGQVGIFDAANVTSERRREIQQHCGQTGSRVLFIELVCTLPEVVESNILETKLLSPDYDGVEAEAAVADFRARIAYYEAAYEPLGEDDLSYIRLVDVGRRLEANQVRGFLPGRLVHFLLNLHLAPRAIWLTRHGESQANLTGILGGDSALSPRGEAYAGRLREFIDALDLPELTVWSSSLLRARQTAGALGRPYVQIRALDEIDAGIYEQLTYAQIAERDPEGFAARAADKLRFRYPGGESYEHVIRRTEPVITELERQRAPVLVVAHQAVLRTLYAYLTGRSREECPRLDIPLHTVIELVPRAYRCVEVRHSL